MVSPDADEERDRGFLTATDRDFLRSPEGKYGSDEAEYNTWRRIRNRTRNAFVDFSLLVEHLPPAQREKIFEEFEESPFHQGVVDALAFVMLGLSDNIVHDQHGIRLGDFERTLDTAYRRAYHELGYIFQDRDPATIRSMHREGIDIEVEYLKETLDDDMYPSPQVMKRLIDAREITPEDFQTLLEITFADEE